MQNRIGKNLCVTEGTQVTRLKRKQLMTSATINCDLIPPPHPQVDPVFSPLTLGEPHQYKSFTGGIILPVAPAFSCAEVMCF